MKRWRTKKKEVNGLSSREQALRVIDQEKKLRQLKNKIRCWCNNLVSSAFPLPFCCAAFVSFFIFCLWAIIFILKCSNFMLFLYSPPFCSNAAFATAGFVLFRLRLLPAFHQLHLISLLFFLLKKEIPFDFYFSN